MEYCGGPTLDQFRLKHKLNEEGVRSLFSQLGMTDVLFIFSDGLTFFCSCWIKIYVDQKYYTQVCDVV